jgi:hypothetical protein
MRPDLYHAVLLLAIHYRDGAFLSDVVMQDAASTIL